MPFVNIKITGKATVAQKNEVIKQVTQTLETVLGKDPKLTHIVIDEVALENWGNCGISAADKEKK
ncbi:MAG: 4-oxalocrotonate tautomerase [uncultured bacterium]|nr:MAG: 4-oxalocrotonate tautomerase [uncultured bacterium]OGT26924.1 MAG: hypothetical protein A3B71_00770 [Gammaproteobacteria bacterium RIFCSPHIGHO2_02_FULL_42_43]OGT28270.1 MAG: hypothetical protein A2624_03210 [Gammaproteobacteria bacterium RIFCSPHIGHO2_01_FULL_42_8]OGT52142.1 MAG: hypothetical protein A3E54_06900 [Gammaproteobacteria bacterium RIFCSPHIGHO2_12_FULL_41_25]OGT62579.1 MAG: hypothetical protein A3I77_02065 [Gammaproteobacteria bacterium RIFCSPLOWO2_02_FULL_42_14]OGT86562.1 MA